jgi:UDP-glucose:(heptosyl)LPS alpha-1,3-glucosyltransferase
VRLVFVRQSNSTYGGGELILNRIIQALAGRGIETAIVARKWLDGPAGLEFIPCNPPKVTRGIRERLFARAACRIVAKQSGALVQAHERIPCCDIFRAGDGVHAAYLECQGRADGPRRRLSQRLSPFHRSMLSLERQMFRSRRLKAVIAISRMVGEDVVRYYDFPPEYLHHIPNGVDLKRFTPTARSALRDQVRKELGAPNQRPVLLFVGSGFLRKGLDLTIRALARIKSDAELWVVGHDRVPLRFAALADKVGLGQRLRMLGTRSDVLPYYAAADAVVLASRYEPFGSVVIEALACGLPVVTSLTTGGREAVERLDPGLVCDSVDIDGLAAAIDRAFELAQEPRTAFAARAIAEDYGMDGMVDRMLALYSRLAPEAGALR